MRRRPPPPIAVILRRANGRYVKRLDLCASKYAAKLSKAFWEKCYDSAYYVEIEPLTNSKDKPKG